MYYNCVTSNDECDLSQDELLKRLQSLAFAINDLALYLDTHPNDEKAIKLHTDYANKYRTAHDRYEREYGPLSIFCPCNSWRWLEGPWPSFILEYSLYITRDKIETIILQNKTKITKILHFYDVL